MVVHMEKPNKPLNVKLFKKTGKRVGPPCPNSKENPTKRQQIPSTAQTAWMDGWTDGWVDGWMGAG
jgi:hypothetical protein